MLELSQGYIPRRLALEVRRSQEKLYSTFQRDEKSFLPLLPLPLVLLLCILHTRS